MAGIVDTRETVLVDLNAVVSAELTTKLERYGRLASNANRYFAAAGIVALVSSIAIPVVTTLVEGPSKDGLVALLAFLTAVATALQGFFQWRAAWRQFTLAGYEIESLLMKWR